MDSLPAPLYIQCLLYIIGNLYDDNDEPIPGLGLLPRQLRIKLLLLLPAIDVCKLEGTSVTRDISMNDEIWKRIWERIFEAKYRRLDKNLADIVSYFVNKKYTPWRDLCFTTMLHLSSLDYSSAPKEFFEISDMNLHMYFAQMKAHIIHGVIMNSRSQLITRKIEGMMDENEIFLDIGTTMASHRKISLKYLELASIVHRVPFVRRVPFYFVRDTKITSSVEAITMRYQYYYRYLADVIKQLLHIVFIENQCHIKFISIYEDLDLILPYLLQQCHLRKLVINCNQWHIAKHSSELRELLKRHIHIEEVLLDCRWIEDYSFLQCFSELMSESAALQKLTLSCRCCAGVSFEVLKNFLAQFFLSPYPVDLSLSMDTFSINFDPLPEPLPINFEQQSKSLSLHAIADVPPNLSSLLPQHIILHSLKINREMISSFAKLKSIKVHKICFDVNVLIDINALSSLVNIVSAKEWVLTAYLRRKEYDRRWPLLNRFTEALATIATNLQQFHVNFCTWECIMAKNILHKVFSSYFELIWDDTDTGYTDYSSNTDTNTISVYKYGTTYDTKYGTFKLKRLQAMDSESLNEMQV